MAVTQERLDRILQLARARESMGYFHNVKAGDQRAASLFARLVAYDDNPEGDRTKSGWLSKSPGEANVDGWAEDAICGNADAADLLNVIDLVNGAGAAGASLPTRLTPSDLKQRRPHNLWVAPKALTAAELAYLTAGGIPVPQPPTIPPFPPRDETLAFAVLLNDHYGRKGATANGTLGGSYTKTRFLDIEGEAVWLSEYLRRRQLGETHEQATQHVLADVDAAWPK